MNMTTTKTYPAKIQKILDAAAANDWQTEIVSDEPHYLSFKVIHPSPGEYDLAYIHLSFWESDGSWRFDGANVVETTRSGGQRPRGTLTMRDSIAAIEGSSSPRKQAAKALDEMARKNRKEALKAAYAAEEDSPDRASLRRELVAIRDAKTARADLTKEVEESGLEWGAGRRLQDALVEEHLSRLAATALGWEGNAYSDDDRVTTLEEATVKVADGALKQVLGYADRGLTGSNNLFVNVFKDVESLAKAKFVEKFHPVYGSYFAKTRITDYDPKWLGSN